MRAYYVVATFIYIVVDILVRSMFELSTAAAAASLMEVYIKRSYLLNTYFRGHVEDTCYVLFTIYCFGISRDRRYTYMGRQDWYSTSQVVARTIKVLVVCTSRTQLTILGASSYKLVAAVSAINRQRRKVGSKLWVSLTRNCKLRIEVLLRSRKALFVFE
jgi:hypothetical protein